MSIETEKLKVGSPNCCCQCANLGAVMIMLNNSYEQVRLRHVAYNIIVYNIKLLVYIVHMFSITVDIILQSLSFLDIAIFCIFVSLWLSQEKLTWSIKIKTTKKLSRISPSCAGYYVMAPSLVPILIRVTCSCWRL